VKRATPGGKAVKLSHDIINVLNKKRKKSVYIKKTDSYDFESLDSVLRRVLGLISRSGTKQELKVIYVLTRPEKIMFEKKADAVGEAMVLAAMNQKRNAEKPIKFKEYV